MITVPHHRNWERKLFAFGEYIFWQSTMLTQPWEMCNQCTYACMYSILQLIVAWREHSLIVFYKMAIIYIECLWCSECSSTCTIIEVLNPTNGQWYKALLVLYVQWSSIHAVASGKMTLWRVTNRWDIVTTTKWKSKNEYEYLLYWLIPGDNDTLWLATFNVDSAEAQWSQKAAILLLVVLLWQNQHSMLILRILGKEY